jgi:GTPase SAR1 family protein
VKTNVWDFAGQEITHGTHQYFLTELSLYLLVLSNRKQDDRSLYRWLPVIKARARDAPIIVAINQTDRGKEHLVMQWDEIRKHNRRSSRYAAPPVTTTSGPGTVLLRYARLSPTRSIHRRL